MNVFLNIIFLTLGFLFGIFYFSTIILSFFYGFPKALLGYFRKELRLKAVLHSLGIFLGWQIFIALIFILMAIFFPRIFDFIETRSGALSFGSFMGFWYMAASLFRKNAREDLKLDYQEFIRPYKIDQKD